MAETYWLCDNCEKLNGPETEGLDYRRCEKCDWLYERDAHAFTPILCPVCGSGNTTVCRNGFACINGHVWVPGEVPDFAIKDIITDVDYSFLVMPIKEKKLIRIHFGKGSKNITALISKQEYLKFISYLIDRSWD